MILIYGSISYFEKIKKDNKTDLITPKNKLKFNLTETKDVYKTEIVLEIEKIYNKDINTTNNLIKHFGILVITKNNKICKKQKMSDQMIDTISIKGLQTLDQYDTLNPVKISVKSNTYICRFKLV